MRESSVLMPELRSLLGSGAAGSATDAQLLERFQDGFGKPEAEVAFAVLVTRHGPMVLGVCRRWLRDPHDVADAFQATFLVLVRKARSVRVEDSLGRWLYGVSRRVAAKARTERARRSRREKGEPGGEPVAADWEHAADRRELFAAIDEEVERLPKPFRAAVELCDLGGLTHEAAAWRLGCPVGTIESRLSRGRKRLREQLARRGHSPMAVGLARLQLPGVPESLSHATVALALRNVAVSTSASILIEAAIKELTMKKLMTMALGVGAIATACGLGMTLGPRVMADHTRPKPMPHPTRGWEKSNPRTVMGLQPPARVKPGDTLLIEVLEALPGRPISGLRVVRPDGTVSLGFYGDLDVAGLNRYEIKVKLIEHLRKTISEDYLGLLQTDIGNPEDPDDDKLVPVDPKDSDRVFVDEASFSDTVRKQTSGATGEKLDRILRSLAELRRPGPASGRPEPEIVRRLADHDRRLGEIESKLDRLIQAIEGLK